MKALLMTGPNLTEYTSAAAETYLPPSSKGHYFQQLISRYRNIVLVGFVWCIATADVQAACSSRSLSGRYGLTTQAIDGAGITATTVSLFEFLPAAKPPHVDRVRELYFVSTPNASWKSSAVGTYAVSRDCHFQLAVIDLDGGPYALTGEFDPRTRTLPVLQTLSNGSSVATGVIRPVGAKVCKPAFLKGQYSVLTQGQVSAGEPPEPLWQSRVGRLVADGYSVDQSWELVNTAGTVTYSPPAFAPAGVDRSCLWNIDGNFPGVIVERGKRLLYMAATPGTLRLGEMFRNP